MKLSQKYISLCTTIAVATFALTGQSIVFGQSASDLHDKISQRNADIKKLESEIAAYQKQIDELSSQASSLSGTIKSLSLTQKKLKANISVTEDKIAAKTYEIAKLGSKIGDKESSISDDRRIIVQALKQLERVGSRDVTEVLLSSQSVSDALNTLDELGTVQNNILKHVGSLRQDKSILQATKSDTEKAKAELLSLNKELSDQRKVVLSTVAEQNALLKETNKSEATYKNLVLQKQQQEAAFQSEIDSYESQLKLLVDASKIPETGTHILKYPLDKVYITQYFGNTDFSTANPQIYNGKGHTGVDFRASIGTPVKAALSGTVIGSANTDIVRGCYSYGQWIMVNHDNGISTLYAHL